ncbi:MAG: AAA family ATPase, partial [Planctomycetota bacterium]
MTLQRDVDAIYGMPSTPAGPVPRTLVSSSHPIGKNEKRDTGLAVVTVRELLNEPPEPIRWLVDGLLPQGGLSILAGKPKAGKSTLARCVGLAVARGDPIIGRETHAGPVVYLGLEDKRSEVAEHFRAMGAQDEPLYIHTGPAPV